MRRSHRLSVGWSWSILALVDFSSHVVVVEAFSAFSPSASPPNSASHLSASSKPSTPSVLPKKNDDWVAESFQKPAETSSSEPIIDPSTGELKYVEGPMRALIYDTTLRDGTQGESVSASVDDKFKILARLSSFNVDFIEAGWPGSNPKDATFFERAKTELNDAQKARLAAFGSTRRKQMAAQDDAQVQALLDSGAPTVCIVAKSHAWQVTEILRASEEENLEMITDTVSYLRSKGRTVMVDLEHFFDGYEHDPQYAVRCCKAAAKAGASCLVLCDTNGGSMPWQVETAVQELQETLKQSDTLVTLGIHCHNDCGMAVANSIVAVQNGVGLVQGTINGIGERTGNADLCSIVPSLALKSKTRLTCREQMNGLTSLSRYVDEILNRTPNHAAPYVGASAFAHKGGLHVAAMKRSSASYQHTDPSEVGNESRVLISELSGRQNIMGKVEAMNLDSPETASDRALAILNRVKQLEAKGYTFEGAEASVDLMVLHASRGYCPPFQVLDYSAQVYDANMDSASRMSRFFPGNDDDDSVCDVSGLGSTARATVKVRTVETKPSGWGDVTDEQLARKELDVHERLEVSDGNGPVDALANALMRALQPVHPTLVDVELVDYKVRILDPESATEAAVRVMIEFRDTAKETTWTTVSVDTNVISASLNALIDGFEYALIEFAEESCWIADEE